MPWRNGGAIGKRNLPVSTVASGVWRLSDIESARRGAAWPATAVLPNIAGLLLWLDADAVSTLLTAPGGDTAVVQGGAVAQWSDQSGNGRHVIQATGVSQPILATSTQTSKRCVRFDGSNDTMVGTHGAGVNAPHTILVAMRITAAGTGADKSAIVVGNRSVNSASNQPRAFYGIPFRYNTTNYGIRSPNRDLAVSPVVSLSAVSFLTYSARINTTNTRIGIAKTFYNVSSVMPLALTDVFEIGRSSPFDSVSFTPMDVHEILIYNSNLTDADVNLVADYFSIKWGTP
jgi:hypothetical protein